MIFALEILDVAAIEPLLVSIPESVSLLAFGIGLVSVAVEHGLFVGFATPLRVTVSGQIQTSSLPISMVISDSRPPKQTTKAANQGLQILPLPRLIRLTG